MDEDKQKDIVEPEDKELYTCYYCPNVKLCVHAYDDFNINGECKLEQQ